MRLLISIILACTVWLAAAQAMALEAVITADSMWSCTTCGIQFSAVDSDGWESVTGVYWDFDNNGTWEITNGDPETYGSVIWYYTSYGDYEVKLKIVTSGDEDTAISDEFFVGEPIGTASTTSGDGPLYVSFDATNSLPSTGRTYQWDFEYDGGTPSWNSTSGSPNHTYEYEEANGNPNEYTCLLRVTWDSLYWCEDEVTIYVYDPE